MHLAAAFVLLSLSCALSSNAQLLHDPYDGLTPIDVLLDTILPPVLNQKPCNENGTAAEFKDFVLNYRLDDSITFDSVQKILERSGFQYENYDVVSDDGYITQIVRIINPLADRTQLKQPPVMVMHGGLTDTSSYLWTGAKLQFPEPFPRTAMHGQMRSSNRSLPIMLANRGYDVFLVGTRGSDKSNMRHVNSELSRSPARASRQDELFKLPHFNINAFEIVQNFARSLMSPLSNKPIGIEPADSTYYNYSFNEIVEFEVPRQIDKVLQVTGAKQVSLIGFSLSTIETLKLVSSNLEYAGKVHSLVSMAPIINHVGGNRLTKFLFFDIILNLDIDTGTLIFTKIVGSKALREFLTGVNYDTNIRYIIEKTLQALLVGPSAKFRTFIDLPLVGHFFMPTGFKELQHFCQIMHAKQMQKFDYGAQINLIEYGSEQPPVYDISDLHIDNWLVVQATNDNFAVPASVQQIIDQVHYPEPYRRIIVPGYNHVDLVAAVDCDTKVNFPIWNFLEAHQLAPSESSNVIN